MEVVNLEDLRHGIRVANYSVEIARQANLSNNLIENIYFSGLFHDIGKAYIDQDIINKPDKLTEHEKEEIKKHPVYSYKEVLKMGYSKDIAIDILFHHENWDGTGYPKGIKGDSIPIGARILKIADVFDALTSERPYRRILDFKVALNIMENEFSTYDPELYYIFNNYFLKKYVQSENINEKNIL